MLKQIPGKIYLSDQRGRTVTEQFIRYSTFNFEDFYNPDKGPLGCLQVFNEEVLAGSKSLEYTVEQPSYIILIPITGTLRVILPSENRIYIDVEEILVTSMPAGSTFQVVNPYQNEEIDFLQVRIKAKQPFRNIATQCFRFDAGALQNHLLEIISDEKVDDAIKKLPFVLSLGRFDGRQEANYSLINIDSHFFAFVMAGAFEMEGRLLHAKDSLALWDTKAVELEALSENALVLILELEHPGN
jgi:quercetin 2,3-dioxygenase